MDRKPERIYFWLFRLPITGDVRSSERGYIRRQNSSK